MDSHFTSLISTLLFDCMATLWLMRGFFPPVRFSPVSFYLHAEEVRESKMMKDKGGKVLPSISDADFSVVD